jgi:hypothetical protein
LLWSTNLPWTDLNPAASSAIRDAMPTIWLIVQQWQLQSILPPPCEVGTFFYSGVTASSWTPPSLSDNASCLENANNRRRWKMTYWPVGNLNANMHGKRLHYNKYCNATKCGDQFCSTTILLLVSGGRCKKGPCSIFITIYEIFRLGNLALIPHDGRTASMLCQMGAFPCKVGQM